MRYARSLLWLLTGVPVGAAMLVFWVGLLAFGLVGMPVLVGLPVLLAVPLLGLPAGRGSGGGCGCWVRRPGTRMVSPAVPA